MRIGIVVLVLLHFCFLLHASAQLTHPDEVDALQAVKKMLVDPKNHLKSWSQGDPCTYNWTGILCHHKVGSDRYFHVKELRLLNMNLSGTLAPELGQLSQLVRLDMMWNQITGSIPKEIGNISSLELLVLNGNQLSGSLPDELGSLSDLYRLQVDENNLSGVIPKSFGNMSSIRHFHMNNNSFSGQLPAELSQLQTLLHLLLDNNDLSGTLPSQFSTMPKLEVLQLDNNHFRGAEIPKSYKNLSSLVKLSLRNCSLDGELPDLSQMSNLRYIDVSWNELTGSIPSNNLSINITTIDLSHNKLKGIVPNSFSDLPLLQTLSLESNYLNGSVPASIWQKSLNGSATFSIDLRDNLLSGVSGALNPSKNVNVRLQGNPVCNDSNIQSIHLFCDSDNGGNAMADDATMLVTCPTTACPVDQYYESVPEAPTCFCAVPIRIGFRLKSPSFTYFPPYISAFESYITRALKMELYQLFIDSYAWEEGPRLRMDLKLFPPINSSHLFNETELHWIRYQYMTWNIPGSPVFGPYELLNFTLLGPYSSANLESGKNSISKGVLAAIIIGVLVCATTASVAVTFSIMRRKNRLRLLSRKSLASIKVDGIKEFTFKELSLATNNFDSAVQVGRGGYGKVYRGSLADDTVVAVKRAEKESLQGTREFLTEIQLSSRVHQRNLVSLIGYCCEKDEQILVYEFMPNGTLREWLSGKHKRTLSFSMRLRIALGSAKGILYLHREANPPIFHRDIKASNILLDSRLIAKVADFGLSRLAPVLDREGGSSNHISTVVRGTPGYLDPEYFLTHKLTDKSDVYSLGVVFLELLTGVPPISHGKNLVREVNVAHESGTLFEILDSRMDACPSECAEKFIDLAIRCCQSKPEMRPCMLDVVRELENMLRMIPESMTMSDGASVQSSSFSSNTSLVSGSSYAYRSAYTSGSDLVSDVTLTVDSR